MLAPDSLMDLFFFEYLTPLESLTELVTFDFLLSGFFTVRSGNSTGLDSSSTLRFTFLYSSGEFFNSFKNSMSLSETPNTLSAVSLFSLYSAVAFCSFSAKPIAVSQPFLSSYSKSGARSFLPRSWAFLKFLDLSGIQLAVELT